VGRSIEYIATADRLLVANVVKIEILHGCMAGPCRFSTPNLYIFIVGIDIHVPTSLSTRQPSTWSLEVVKQPWIQVALWVFLRG
jgi:hypothetical protein